MFVNTKQSANMTSGKFITITNTENKLTQQHKRETKTTEKHNGKRQTRDMEKNQADFQMLLYQQSWIK